MYSYMIVVSTLIIIQEEEEYNIKKYTSSNGIDELDYTNIQYI